MLCGIFGFVENARHAPTGHKPIAQGIALGDNCERNNAPCKGKSTITNAFALAGRVAYDA